jgi:hypothetical protein
MQQMYLVIPQNGSIASMFQVETAVDFPESVKLMKRNSKAMVD